MPERGLVKFFRKLQGESFTLDNFRGDNKGRICIDVKVGKRTETYFISTSKTPMETLNREIKDAREQGYKVEYDPVNDLATNQCVMGHNESMDADISKTKKEATEDLLNLYATQEQEISRMKKAGNF